MKPLPENAAALACGFKGLPDDRKAEVLGHLQALPPREQQQAIRKILNNGDDEARFVGHLLGKQVPGPDDSPDNKQKASVQTK